MGFQYTKKKEDDEQQERTVQAEDFAKLMFSMKRRPDRIKQEPKQKGQNNEQTTTCRTDFQ